MKRLNIVAALLISGAISLPSMGGVKIREQAFETSASQIRLPTSEVGELTLQTCPTCRAMHLRASAKTRYQIGQQRVSLADLTQFIAKNPSVSLVVMQLNGTNDLSRIKVFATLPGFAK